VWQWMNYDCAQIPAGKTPLRINLDETAICLYQGEAKGTVFASKRRQRDGGVVQRVGLGKRRCYLTHIALICDRSDVQPILPQTIIGNEHTFLVRSMAALRAACPGNVTIIRQKSAWNNEVLCAAVVRKLARVLQPFMGTVQPLLFLDAVRLHTTARVLRACADVGIWAVVVPARTTWLLQPLDTDAFLSFKQRLRELYQGARARSADGDVGVDVVLACVYDAIRIVFQGRQWSAAFDRVGLRCGQLGVAPHVLRQLRLEGQPVVPAVRPTDNQLRECFPRRCTVRARAALLWRPFDGARAVHTAPVGRGAAGATGAARTRGDHARAATRVMALPGASGGESRLVAALARGRPLVVPRGWPLLRGRGRGRGK
jgi:hypothetical protein